MDQVKLSKYGYRSSIPSAINEMTEEFASDFREGIDINLGVGYVNDRTIPAKEIVKGLIHFYEKYDKLLEKDQAFDIKIIDWCEKELKSEYGRTSSTQE